MLQQHKHGTTQKESVIAMLNCVHQTLLENIFDKNFIKRLFSAALNGPQIEIRATN